MAACVDVMKSRLRLAKVNNRLRKSDRLKIGVSTRFSVRIKNTSAIAESTRDEMAMGL